MYADPTWQPAGSLAGRQIWASSQGRWLVAWRPARCKLLQLACRAMLDPRVLRPRRTNHVGSSTKEKVGPHVVFELITLLRRVSGAPDYRNGLCWISFFMVALTQTNAWMLNQIWSRTPLYASLKIYVFFLIVLTFDTFERSTEHWQLGCTQFDGGWRLSWEEFRDTSFLNIWVRGDAGG